MEARRPTPFDIGEINETLAGLTWLDQDDPADGGAGQKRDFPGPLDDLIDDVRTSAGKKELRQLISDARVDQPVLVDAGTATWMVRPYTWLLDRVGDDGIKLTGAGYLPPVHVEGAGYHIAPPAQMEGKGREHASTESASGA